jgi:hypothetical protein
MMIKTNVKKLVYQNVIFMINLLATLNNFIKELLSSHHMKSEKLIFDLLDKITLRYVNHISTIASQICTERGKKTLNVDHVIDALKQMQFDNHIKKLSSELDLTACQNEEKQVVEDVQEMKELINKQKKKSKKKKKHHEFNDEMVNEQLELFERSRMENLPSLMPQNSFLFESSEVIQSGNALILPNNKKMRLDQIEQDLFQTNKNKTEEVDFD